MESKRTFLEKVLAAGLDTGMITTDDIVKHGEPTVLAGSLPVEIKAKLLDASLKARRMDTELIVQTLGTHDIAKHLPTHVLWACVAECGARAIAGSGDAIASTKTRAADTRAETSSEISGGSVAVGSTASTGGNGKSQGAIIAAASKISGKNRSAKANLPKSPMAKTKAAGASKSAAAKAKTKTPRPKPNAKAPAAKPSARNNRAATAPIVPSSDFEIDTDIGEDWGVDDIVEVVEEADLIVSAGDDTSINDTAALADGDWKKDDETRHS